MRENYAFGWLLVKIEPQILHIHLCIYIYVDIDEEEVANCFLKFESYLQLHCL